MATAAALQSPSSNSDRIVWFWQSNPNPFNDDKQKEWKRYSDFENEYIEEAYQRKEKEVQLNDYIINFRHNMQFNKQHKNKQRPVKRELIDIRNYVRDERFCYPKRAVKSFAAGIAEWCALIGQWLDKNEQIRGDNPAIALLAAQGILQEDKLLNEEFDAQRMADRLRSCSSREEIFACAARLYSAESFLYKLVNSTLRNGDISKVDTLGAFYYLLNFHILSNAVDTDELFYRGANLTDEMIEEYRKVVGAEIIWVSYTSTSKDRQVAEQFGNTVFIIHLLEFTYQSKKDISSLSVYPHEQEVLLQAGYRFLVDQIKRDSISGKYLIYMRGIAR